MAIEYRAQMLEFNEKDNHIYNQKEKIDSILFQEQNTEDNNQNNTFHSTSERYFITKQNLLLSQKRENDFNPKLKEKHTKFSYDNLKRECKHLVIENVIKFINNKIYEVYEGNIGKGLSIKKLFKLNQTQKINADVQFNKLFINKTLNEILSQDITKKFKFYEHNHNKKVIENLLLEKKDEFEKIFNITFIDCVKHFIGDKEIEELNGLTLFSELKEEIIKKHEKDGESYYENLKLFLKGFENKITRAKSRKKRNEISSI